jgi:alkanesulfonate monooxygenase SsuD/methylene tetrahydromethanopterin reductase-like flavin-dependent oxidoreductase (luciferase family)
MAQSEGNSDVKFGIALPMYDLETGRTLRLAEMADFAQRAESLGYDSIWAMDHFWLENVGRRTGGHDPLAILAYLAAKTERIALGTLVVCNSFRNVGQLARETAALADAAEDRLILGLGCGWGEAEHHAFGFRFDHRVDRLEETLSVLPALLGGERRSIEGTQVQLRDANVLTTAAAPELWIAAFGPRLLGLAGKYADGWNTAWHGPDTSRFEREVGALRAAIQQAGRSLDAVTISVGLWMLPVAGEELDEAERRALSIKPANAPASWPDPLRERAVTGTVDQVAGVVEDYIRLGAKHIIANPSVSPFSRFDPSYIDRAAAVLRKVKRL